MSLIKASITAGVRPSVMIVGAKSNKPWNDMDRHIMEAYQIVQDERCDQCGQPRWLCMNTDPMLIPRVKHEICEGSRALRDFQDRLPEGEDRGGAYVEFYARDGRPLSDFRALFYQQQQAAFEEAERERAEEASEE